MSRRQKSTHVVNAKGWWTGRVSYSCLTGDLWLNSDHCEREHSRGGIPAVGAEIFCIPPVSSQPVPRM